MSEALDLRLVRPATFEPLLNSEFASRDPAAAFRLVAVERHGEQPHAPRREPFSLVFAGEPEMEQRIYSLESPALGRLELFLVPIGPDPEGRQLYEAVFN